METGDLILLVIGAVAPDEDINALATKMLNALVWELPTPPSAT